MVEQIIFEDKDGFLELAKKSEDTIYCQECKKIIIDPLLYRDGLCYSCYVKEEKNVSIS